MSKDKKDETEAEKPPLDLNAVGKAFVEHYYTLFDGNRMQLADLFVCIMSIFPITIHITKITKFTLSMYF